MTDPSTSTPQKSASKTASDSTDKETSNAAKRVEKGDPKPKDVNPLAPPVNIEAGS